jgi:hypothetical protein
LADLKAGRATEVSQLPLEVAFTDNQIPVYSFNHHRMSPAHSCTDGRTYAGKEVPVRSECHNCVCELSAHRRWLMGSEGIMALQSPEMRALYDLKVFVVSQLSALLGLS